MLPTLPQTTEESSLNESPSKKEGKFRNAETVQTLKRRLNESPSKKEGKLKARRSQP